MKYDLIVAGAGPAGLMAARTAAEDGLKVVLVERKKDITQINRLCGQFTNISLINVSGRLKYGYTKPLGLEVTTSGNRIFWPEFGFSLEYSGPIRPYMNYVYVSPSGHRVYREKNRFYGFFSEKEGLLGGLLKLAEKAGVTVVTEATALGAENTASGVRVRVRRGDREEAFEAKRAIAAEGKESALAESLGLNKKRQVLGTAPMRLMGYVVEGVDCDLRINSWVNMTNPGLSPRGNFWMYMLGGDRNIVGGPASAERSAVENVDALMKSPAFRPWFHKAEIVRRVAVASGAPTYAPLMEPYEGNVLAIGDAACLIEVTNPGAIACGYLGAKATVKEMNGQKGYAEYAAWWAKSFDTNDPDYLKAAGRNFAVNAVCNDEDTDYLYKTIGDRVGLPAVLVADSLERIKEERPALHAKLAAVGVDRDLQNVKIDLAKVMAAAKAKEGK